MHPEQRCEYAPSLTGLTCWCAGRRDQGKKADCRNHTYQTDIGRQKGLKRQRLTMQRTIPYPRKADGH